MSGHIKHVSCNSTKYFVMMNLIGPRLCVSLAPHVTLLLFNKWVTTIKQSYATWLIWESVPNDVPGSAGDGQTHLLMSVRTQWFSGQCQPLLVFNFHVISSDCKSSLLHSYLFYLVEMACIERGRRQEGWCCFVCWIFRTSIKQLRVFFLSASKCFIFTKTINHIFYQLISWSVLTDW